MTGPSLGPILSPCPFAHCAAQPMLVIEQASASDDEATVQRIPMHQIVGDGSRFGQCPASLMVVPLDRYSREQLRTQGNAMNLMLRAGNKADPRGDPAPPIGSREHPLTPRGNPDHELTRRGYADVPKRPTAGPVVSLDGHLGQSVVPLPDVPHAGPGPGRASKPYQPTAENVVEIVPRPKLQIVGPDDQPSQGSTEDMSNDLRAQLIALTTLSIEGFAQQQEQCAALSNMIEGQLTAVRQALGSKQSATHGLAIAAVGSQSSIPVAAANMIGASSSIRTTLDEVEAASASLLGWVAAAHAYAANAAAYGRSYLAQI